VIRQLPATDSPIVAAGKRSSDLPFFLEGGRQPGRPPLLFSVAQANKNRKPLKTAEEPPQFQIS